MDEKELDAQINKRFDDLEKRHTPPDKMGFFKKCLGVLTKPTKFFEEIKIKEKRMFGALSYLLILLVVVALLRIIVDAWDETELLISILTIFLGSFFLFVAYALVVVAYTYLAIAFVHQIIKWIGGTQPYYQTFKAIVYGFTPVLLVAWLPTHWILLPFLLCAVILQTLGLHKLQEISKLKAGLLSLLLVFMNLLMMNLLNLR